jgi:SAM-dependent methyltransferase
MAATTTKSESSRRWGRLWGARPEDWAATEEQQAPTYEEAIRRLRIERGHRVLDIGCGTGVFLRLAADRGAHAFGLDASEELVEIARRRVPEADVRVGEMERLPYDDDAFDRVTGFNAFFFADDMVAALREAGRVAKPGAPVVIQVWGRPERCGLEAMKIAVSRFLPGASSEGRRPPDFWKPGVLEAMATEAGLAPGVAFDTSWAFVYPDEESMLRSMLSAGGLALVAHETGGGLVETAIAEALEPYRTPDGGYRVDDEWHYLIAAAP